MRSGPTVGTFSRQTQANQGAAGNRRAVGKRGRTAVVDVAANAPVFVEGRAEPPHANGFRGHYPRFVELLVAFGEPPLCFFVSPDAATVKAS